MKTPIFIPTLRPNICPDTIGSRCDRVSALWGAFHNGMSILFVFVRGLATGWSRVKSILPFKFGNRVLREAGDRGNGVEMIFVSAELGWCFGMG